MKKPLPLSNTAFLESYLLKITTRSRTIYWIIIGLIVVVVGALPFIYTDISIVAPGYFRSELEKQKIIIPFQGKVIRASVKNGSRVEKGDTLFIIDSEAIRARKIACEKKISDNVAAIHDLKILISVDSSGVLQSESEFITERYYLEYSNMLKAHNIQLQTYEKIKSDFERSSLLFNKQIIPAVDYEKSLLDYSTGKENLKHVTVTHLSQWHTDLMQRETLASVLDAELNECREELSNRVIKAPVGGVVIQSAEIQEGMVATYNQVVAEISPDGRLMATCYVDPSDVGLITSGQKVRIQVHAFNYNEWGLLNASITEISDDMVIENGTSAFFRVECLPEKTWLSLSNGIRADLKKGMNFNARIILTRRSLFNLLFDKVDKWMNPNRNDKKLV